MRDVTLDPICNAGFAIAEGTFQYIWSISKLHDGTALQVFVAP